ncbi:MAG: GumC family protein [Gemmatimonadota bacterium]
MGIGPDEGDGIGVSLSGIVEMFWRRKWTIGLIALVVFSAVAVKTLRTPKVYRSTVTVLVEQGEGRGSDSPLEVLEGVGRTDSPLETEARLIMSQRVIEPVVRELYLHTVLEKDGEPLRPDDVFTFFSAAPDALPGEYSVELDEDGTLEVRDAIQDTTVARAATPGGSEPARVEFAGVTLGVAPGDEGIGGILRVGSVVERALALREAVGAGPVSLGANLVNISCMAGEPVLAQRICDAVSRSYMRLRTEVQHAEAEAAIKFLGEQVDEVGERLAQAEDSLGAYQERNLAVALDHRASAEVSQYSSLELQREQFETERAALASLLREVEQAGEGGQSYRDLATFPGFVRGGNPVVSKLMQTLIDLEDQRSQLAITRTDRNPDIVAIDTRIEEIENQLNSFATTYERSLEKQVRSMEQAMGRSQGQLSAIPARQVASSRLERQVNLLQELYTFLQTRLREAEIARNITLPGVQIVDTASMPAGPDSPDVQKNLLLGLLLGLLMGTVVALYREYTDSRIRGRKEVERSTGIPVLGMIPSVGRPGPILAIAATNGSRPDLPGERPLSGLPEGRRPLGVTLRARTLDQQLALEAFHSLLTDLKYAASQHGAEPIRSVAVTSATRGDGKTFTACNLAIASAAQGRRTLLVDTDLRASGVARFFDMPGSTPGLVEVLEGDTDYRTVLNNFEIVGDHSSLQVIPSGRSESPHGGILERCSGRLESLFGDAEAQYELVVVDTPPLNVITDAASITTRADAVLVVVRGGVTDRNALELTLQRLRLLNANVMGIVLNDVDLPEYYTSYSQPDAD